MINTVLSRDVKSISEKYDLPYKFIYEDLLGISDIEFYEWLLGNKNLDEKSQKTLEIIINVFKNLTKLRRK